MKTNISLKTAVPTILSIMIVLVVLLEILGAYLYWYKGVNVEVVDVGSDSIVRVDLPGYRAVSSFLGGLNNYAPDDRAANADNPFTFR